MHEDPFHGEGFTRSPLTAALRSELRHGDHVFRLAAWDHDVVPLPGDATHYGFVHSGSCSLQRKQGRSELIRGMYFSLPGGGTVGGEGRGLVISQVGYRGLFQLGGPIERVGRLQYIDGCSDTLLLSPVVFGDACLNLLVIPPGTNQTAHTHPSFRAGLIAAGCGACELSRGRAELSHGDVFVIDPDGVHSFHTEASSLAVIAFHPDSDFGPHRDDHPMVNRTIVEGVSAARLSPAERRLGEYVR